ncbi:hypothetical protein [Novosphingobium profundi]|uniref:hypothetical protein n=1 Tax=Novosphingobium profundi TaxID=1774954 RepID=UPI001CFD4B08|nr:hypothetical protein [Novosphingobium profundi]
MKKATTAMLVAACSLGVATPALAGTHAGDAKFGIASMKSAALNWSASKATGASGKGKGHTKGKGKGHGNGRGKGHIHDNASNGC